LDNFKTCIINTNHVVSPCKTLLISLK